MRKHGLGYLAAGLAAALLVSLLSTGVRRIREQANAMNCRCNLGYLGFALINFHDFYGCLPPAYLPDDNGKPQHSWRVLLLPFMEQHTLFERYDFTEPWNGPNNSRLADMVHYPGGKVFRCPSAAEGPLMETCYVAVVGPTTRWPGGRPGLITAQSESQILLIEVADSGIHWMEPRDLSAEQVMGDARPAVGLRASSPHPRGIHCVTAGDLVRTFPRNYDVQLLREKLVPDAGPPASREAVERCVRQLERRLADDSWSCRLVAALLLGQLGPDARDTVPALRQALGDKYQQVRTAARQALRRIDPAAAEAGAP
jgi:hypothetical protein